MWRLCFLPIWWPEQKQKQQKKQLGKVKLNEQQQQQQQPQCTNIIGPANTPSSNWRQRRRWLVEPRLGLTTVCAMVASQNNSINYRTCGWGRKKTERITEEEGKKVTANLHNFNFGPGSPSVGVMSRELFPLLHMCSLSFPSRCCFLLFTSSQSFYFSRFVADSSHTSFFGASSSSSSPASPR